MAVYVRELIGELREGGGPAEAMVPEPAFEIEEVGDEPGGYDFEIGLSDEIAHVHSRKVDGLVRQLSREDGVLEVLREDRELVRVRAPSWSAETLELWLAPRLRTGWISALMRRFRQE